MSYNIQQFYSMNKTSTQTITTSTTTTAPDPDLHLYWDANNYSGSGSTMSSVVSNLVWNINGAQFIGAPTYSFFFDGVDDFIGGELPWGDPFYREHTIYGTGSFTVEAWMIRPAVGNTFHGGWQTGATAGAFFSPFFVLGNAGLIFYWDSGPGGFQEIEYRVQGSVNALTTGNWNHFVFTGTFSNTTTVALQAWLNGATAAPGGIGQQTRGNFTSQPTGRYIFGEWGTPVYPLRGQFAYLKLWNRKLTDQEIIDSYNNTKSRFGL